MSSFILWIPDEGKKQFEEKKGVYTDVERRPIFANIVKSLEQDLSIERLIVICPSYSADYVYAWTRNRATRLPFEIVPFTKDKDPQKMAEAHLDGIGPKDIIFVHAATHPALDLKSLPLLKEAAEKTGASALLHKNYHVSYQVTDGKVTSVGDPRIRLESASTMAVTCEVFRKMTGIASEEEELTPIQAAVKAGLEIEAVYTSVPDVLLKTPEDVDSYVAVRKYFYSQNDLADQYFHDRLISLKAFDAFCQESGLTYFAIGELLQGAVFYQRPIPGDTKSNWHVAMFREDYDKFTALLKEKGKAAGFTHNLGSVGRDEKLLWVRQTIMVDELTEGRGGKVPRDLGKIYISIFDTFPGDKDEVHYLKRTSNKLNQKLDAQIKFITGKGESGLGRIIKRNIKNRFVNRKSAYKNYKKQNKIFSRYQGDPRCSMAGRLVGGQTRFIPMNELLPLQKVPFGDMMLPAPKDPGTWAQAMTPEVKDRIDKIQKVDLVLLKEFDRVCKQIGIGYFLCGGSMLGKVRHDGFIPWDDDIDCGMLRDDYNKFLAEAPKYLNTDLFFLQNRYTDKMCPYMFSKIRVNGTEYITDYNDGRKFHKGICLDIFPFDVIPTDMKERNDFLREVNQKVRIHNSLCNRQRAEVVHEYPAKSFSERWHRFTFKVARGIYKLLPLSKTQNAYIKTATRYNDRPLEPETWVASFIPTYTFVQIKNLLPYQRVNFEGVDTYLMNRPDIFLTMQYGDYMKLPPIHKQMGHDLIRWKADLPETQGENKE